VARPGYGADYRAQLKELRANPRPCQLRIPGTCTYRATSLDHQPPLALHRHVDGSGCCRLVPSCLPCNLRAGRWRVVNARKGRRVKPLPSPIPAPSRRW
jgi:hypothetical protein